jgi:glutamine phosphoribosylpyrophosphate amidotransferase
MERIYNLIGLIINNSSTQTIDADLSLGYDKTKEAFLKASVNYKTLSMRANALIENLSIYTNGNIENDKALINLVIKEQLEGNINNETQGKSLLNILSKSPSDEHTIAVSDLEIDLKTFDTKLNLRTDSLKYESNISLSPVKDAIYPKLTKPYIIYTDGILEINDEKNPLN